jgi:hypothetical protein
MMKPTPRNPSKNNQTGLSKLNFFQKMLIFISLLIIAFTVLPAVVVLLLGLLPTLTVVITDTKNINKITTVGCFNISGVMICLNNLFNQFSSGTSFSLRNNVYDIVIMLLAAAVGVFLYYVLPDLFAYIFKNSAQHRLKVINARLDKLKEHWANIFPENR